MNEPNLQSLVHVQRMREAPAHWPGNRSRKGPRLLLPQQRMLLRSAAMELNGVRIRPLRSQPPTAPQPARRGAMGGRYLAKLLRCYSNPLVYCTPGGDPTLKRAVIALARDDVHVAGVAINKGAQRRQVCGG